MNTQERTHPVILIAITIAIAAVMVTAALLLPGKPAQATHVTPEFLSGSSNPGKTCGELEGSGQSWLEFKLEQSKGNLSSGTHTDGTLTVTISNFTFGDTSFDWTSNIGVDGVVVKDGVDGANFYLYDPEDTADTGLSTPDADKAISHISFCYDEEEATPTPTPSTPTPTSTPAAEASPTPTTSTPAPTATLAATLAATSTPTPAVLAAVALPDTGQPPAAGSTTAALLLLALGGLLVLGGAGTVVAVTVTRRR